MGFQSAENPEAFGNAVKRAERIVDLVTVGKCREFDSLHSRVYNIKEGRILFSKTHRQFGRKQRNNRLMTYT